MRHAQVALEYLILTGIALLILTVFTVYTVNRFEANSLTLQRRAVHDMAERLEHLLLSMSRAEPGISYTFPWRGSVYGIPLTLTFYPGGFHVNGSKEATSRLIPLLNSTLRVDGNATLIFTRNTTTISVHLA